MQRRRLSLLAAAIAALAFVVAPGTANAYFQNYCGIVLNPGGPLANPCYSSGLHSWDRNEARYPGTPQNGAIVCEYQWNNRTSQIRGGVTHCDYGVVWFDWGVTTQADYNARVYLSPGNCCRHTVNGHADG